MIGSEDVRKRLEAIEEEIDGELEGWFDSLVEPLNEVNGVLESKFLKRFLAEFGKLKTKVMGLSERLRDCREELENNDAELESLLEERLGSD